MISDHELDIETKATILSEEELNEKNFELFFKENFLRLCLFCQYKFGFDMDMAKEMVHTGFIKLWETRHRISGMVSVKSYLFRIVTNNCLDVLRHEKIKIKYEKTFLASAAINNAKEDFANIDLKQLESEINEAINELPDQMRKVFELSRFEGLKYAEISQQLGISVKTVETHMGRALGKLRCRFSKYLAFIGSISIISIFKLFFIHL